MMMASDVLVVDDEADIRDLVAGILADEGYAVRTATDSESALGAIRARKPALLILDIWMAGGGMDGLELLDLVKNLDADLPVIMISGHGNIETAVSSIKRGAYEFLEKPFKSDRLLLVVERALEAANLRRENRRLRTQAITPEGMTGKSVAAQQLRQMIAKLAGANSRVLISGPPGSGKETVARLIHAGSARQRNEFVAISAAGMTPERMDVELFGEEGDAGRTAKIGVFERAHAGTLYLDEVADMPRETQGRILRVLVEQRFRRVGGDSDVQVDVRVVSSTSRDLRQLRNNVERMLILASGTPADPITAAMLPAEAMVTDQAVSLGAERMIALPLREAREVFEREYLNAQMLRFSGNISRTAAFIGMERSALHRKLKSLGLSGARALEEELGRWGGSPTSTAASS